MELKCLKWVLFLLCLLIVATEGLQGSALKRGEKKNEEVSRTRGSTRRGSRFATSTSAPAEPKVEVASAKREYKPRNRDPSRFSSRKLASKAQQSEVKKSAADDSSVSSTQGKAYLPEPSTDFRRTGRVLKDKDNVQNIEPPKVDSGRSTGRRGPSRFSRDRSKAKSEAKEESNAGPSVFQSQTENTRSRTGRKIQSNTVLTGRQLKSSVPSSSRYSRVDSSDKSELKPAESMQRSSRRSFNTKPEPEDNRQAASRLRYDIAASGSESVRINIPLSFPVDSESTTSTESSRRPIGSRYKLRGRQEASNDHKPEVEINTASNRGISRRFEGSPSSTTTEAATSRARGRNSYSSRKSNTVTVEIGSTTTAAPDQRRRSFNGKSTPRGFEATRAQPNKLAEAQSLENKRSNRPRGRYKVESSSPNTLVPVSSTVTPNIEVELTAAPPTQPPVTSTTGKTSRMPLQSVTFVAPPTSDAQITKRQNNFGNRPGGQGRRGSKEDFFNHGLGFRGRRPPGPNDAPTVPPPITTTTSAPATTAAPPADSTGRGNPGWTLRRRPGHWHDGNPPGNPGDPTAPVDQGTSTASSGTTPKGARRGNKTFVQGGNGNQQISEDDNYPPDFKARLALLIQQKGAGQTRGPLEASKMSTSELFAARSRVKLENARKLVKPELNIDETSSRPVVGDAAGQSKDEKPSDDSAVDEGQKVFKVARKSSATIRAPPTEPQKITTKSDWKPATKLRKHFKEAQQARTSRYKQGSSSAYTAKPKSSSSSTASAVTKKSSETESEGAEDKSKQSRATGRYQEYKYKFVPKNRGSKLRGPTPSHDGVAAVVHEENSIPSTKSPLIEKSRKTFASRKSEKSSVEDIKAVALKLRKTLESIEKSNQTPRPPRRSDSPEGSTTLLTTMRTVKSFSFSTRLVKDDGEAIASSTQKMSEDEPTTLAPITTQATSTSFTVATQQPTTTTLPISDDLINEIENSGVSSTTDSGNDLLSAVKSTRSPDYEPPSAALTNDTGSPVYVVYPSATEKPLSVAITPKVYRYHATVKPDDELLGQPLALQQSVVQEPVISVKVSSGDGSADNSIVLDSNSNIFNPAQSAKILETGNATILEQLRSTVAPLLSTLGAKSPVFQSVYKNTNSANSLPRVTPSGAPPRFSARYRGAELFVRRPTPPTNSLPSNGKDALNIDVSSPGEPKVLTYYQAVETASINNEQTDVRHLWQLGRADQVESTTKNSSNSDLPSVIPITVTNTINDAGPSPSDNATTAPTTDTTMIATATTKTIDNIETTQQQPTVESDEALIMTTGSTTSIMDSPDAADLKLVTLESSSTSRPTSTSTELITEVSVSIGDRVNSITEFTTSSPTTTSEPKSSSVLTTTMQTADGFLSESSTDMPTTLPTLVENSVVTTESSVEATTTSSVVGSASTEESTSQMMLEKLDYSSTMQPIILPAEGVVVNGNRSNGRIILDRERNEATKTNQDAGQRNSVFIGQDKFVNYWTNGQPNSPPTVLSVNIKSTATAANEGPLSVPARPLNLDILPNKSSGKSVTAPPGFPWKDALEQIFGITTTPGTPITASVASNTIDDSTGENAAISASPINNLVEIFSPVSSTIESLINTPTKPTTLPPETTTMTTTPTPIPVFSSTTEKPLTMNPNAFGTTFDDLAFLNALLEKTAPNKGTPKTLTEVEQLLANKILSLALGRPLTNGGPTRSPKAIQPSNASPNSVGGSDDSKFSTPLPTSTASLPIVINLHPTTTAKPSTTTAFTWKPIKTFSSYDDFTTPSTSTTSTSTTTTTPKPTTTTTTTTTPAPTTTKTTTTTTTTTTQRPTTRQPVIITAKPVTTRRPRPRPTTPPPPAGPFAFAVNFFQSLFGRPTTTPRPVVRRPAPTARKIVSTTQRVTTSSYKPTEVASKAPSVGQASTTFSPEDDAKFLAALLDVARNSNGGDKRSVASSSQQQVLNADDEEFLRALLNGEGAKIKPLSSVGGNDQKDAALLAAFLKAQGLEPSTPSSLGKLTSTTTTTTTTTTTFRTTTTRRRPPPAASTYPPPLFSNFGVLSSGSGGGFGSAAGDVASSSGGEGTVRSQVVNAAIGMTRAFGQFIGAAITGAAQSFQSFVKNGTSLWG